jgi:hypothetical protein
MGPHSPHSHVSTMPHARPSHTDTQGSPLVDVSVESVALTCEVVTSVVSTGPIVVGSTVVASVVGAVVVGIVVVGGVVDVAPSVVPMVSESSEITGGSSKGQPVSNVLSQSGPPSKIERVVVMGMPRVYRLAR